MNLFSAFALVLALGGDEPAKTVSLDSDVQTVATVAGNRLVVYRTCSPEHCWSVSYLQWFEDGVWPERKVSATKEVPELGYGMWVDWVKGTLAGEQAQFEVQVSPSHGGFDPFTMILIPGSPGAYTTSGAPKYAK